MTDKPDLISETKTLLASITLEAASITFPVRLAEALCTEIDRLRAELSSRDQDMTQYMQTEMLGHREIAAQVEQLQAKLKAARAKVKELRAEAKPPTAAAKPSKPKAKPSKPKAKPERTPKASKKRSTSK